jgi:urease accessory protein
MELAPPPIAAQSPPRARGAARLSVAAGPGPSRLVDLRLEGSLKLLFPRGADHRQAVVLNTSGGLTGGDRMALDIAVGDGADLTVTTQAAERVYRAASGRAEVEAGVTIGAGARLDWLPQETILFDGAALRRRLTVRMHGTARLLLVEPLILGRAAMGEVVRQAFLSDRWDIWRDGRLIRADALRLTGDVTNLMARAGGGAGAMASILVIAPGAEGRLPPLPDGAAASSPLPGTLSVRMLAPDGFTLRQRLIPVIEHLAGRALPKVWRL